MVSYFEEISKADIVSSFSQVESISYVNGCWFKFATRGASHYRSIAFFFPLYSELDCEIDIRWIGIVMEEEHVGFGFYNDFVQGSIAFTLLEQASYSLIC